MEIVNKTDRYDILCTPVRYEIGEEYGYYYDKAKRHNLQQRVDYHIMYSSHTTYVGLLTFNDNAVTDTFEWIDTRTGERYIFKSPYNLQRHDLYHTFFKKIQKAIKRTFGADCKYTYVSEQGEGGETHNYKGERGKDNNPHIHFLLYIDRYIAPSKIERLIKYFWQGGKECNDPTASFAKRYKYERNYDRALYGKAGLSDKNRGIVGTGDYNSHTASGYLTEYLCKDFDAYKFKMHIRASVYEQYKKYVSKSDDELTLSDKEELKAIYHHLSIYHLPRELHSNGVGAIVWQKRDKDYKVLSYKDYSSPRTSLCSYIRRKYMFDHRKHPTRLTKKGKPVICYEKNHYYIDAKLRSQRDNIENTKRAFSECCKVYGIPAIMQEYDKYLAQKSMPRYDFDPSEVVKDIEALAIYHTTYKGRRFLLPAPPVFYEADLERFLWRELNAPFRDKQLHKVQFDNNVLDYSSHPSFSPCMHNYAGLCRFSQFYSKLKSDAWLEKRKQEKAKKRRQTHERYNN